MKGSPDREHHTYNGTLQEHEPVRWHYVNGCRHPDCVEANRIYQQVAVAERTQRLLADPTLVPHGRENTYGNWGCRCLPCCVAHAVKMQSDRQRAISRKSYRKKHPVVQRVRTTGSKRGRSPVYVVPK